MPVLATGRLRSCRELWVGVGFEVARRSFTFSIKVTVLPRVRVLRDNVVIVFEFGSNDLWYGRGALNLHMKTGKRVTWKLLETGN